MSERPFTHVPVMRDEIVAAFHPVGPGTVVDATVGGAGHAVALLADRTDRRLIGLDRDADAVAAATSRLAPFGDRARVEHRRFDALGASVGRADQPVVGVLFDLGVSSWQLDEPGRGFSYRHDAPLDMRMDRSQADTAADIVNGWDEASLARLLAVHGEPRLARRISRSIVAARPITTTGRLADVVAAAVPAAARRAGHPAKRVFQAVRAALNEELDLLGPALDAAIELLAPGGRLAVLAYHSGEDRIVKQRLLDASTGGCTCPPGLPCGCGAVPVLRLLNRGARKPGAAEVAANPRAASARLRVAEKLAPSIPPSVAHEVLA